eukprot:comp20698_c0_seq1/m.26973 comp20698_c0_seq1/g.26973  ORF comp20698_c0_seq1/g.26973 comp20698_c0_seq1/m.26973 type:complete len:298 (-) comp20698_c0_seq1:637-1530(-)
MQIKTIVALSCGIATAVSSPVRRARSDSQSVQEEGEGLTPKPSHIYLLPGHETSDDGSMTGSNGGHSGSVHGGNVNTGKEIGKGGKKPHGATENGGNTGSANEEDQTGGNGGNMAGDEIDGSGAGGKKEGDGTPSSVGGDEGAEGGNVGGSSENGQGGTPGTGTGVGDEKGGENGVLAQTRVIGDATNTFAQMPATTSEPMATAVEERAPTAEKQMSASNENSNGGVNAGAIIGGVAAGIAVVGALFAGVVYYRRRSQAQALSNKEMAFYEGTHNNPLFVQATKENSNPLYANGGAA